MIRAHVLVCAGAGCISSGGNALKDALAAELKKRGLDGEIQIVETGCMGPCDLGPVMLVHPEGTFYQRVTALDVPELVEEHFIKGRPCAKLLPKDELTSNVVTTQRDFAFFAKQEKIVLENCGLIDAENIEEYIARDGYAALGKVLTGMTTAQVIAEIKASGLRGRGGAGFPTGVKWELMAKAAAKPKYVICNADEGDPGAFMNRAVLEGDPHRVLEGMAIGAYAMGANRGFIYIRAEYPLAIKRLNVAIAQAYQHGLLGKNLFETGFDFDIEIRIGAGAFVCGEETALMRSIEGRRGQPQPRPPFPAQRGLWGKPTNINNVETWATIKPIILKGAKWYATFGTEKTKGTKVFALAGKIRNTGLAEVPYGTTLRDIIFGIGGGIPNGKLFKAVQTGGPSGGVIPPEHLDTPLEYETLQKLGSIMGSGGLVVMDEDACMVDVAHFFMEFCCDESCGKCPPCRVGTRQMLNLLERIKRGEADLEDLRKLEELSVIVRDASLCGLGQTAPNPVLTTLRYFRKEYEEHIREHRCPAGVCQDLFLSPCENSCPLHMNIPGYLQLLKEDRLDDAFELVLLDNPLPASTGRVCQHPCEIHCRRATVDSAVNMREVHRYIADTIFQKAKTEKIVKRLNQRKMAATGKRVAIVGAGPAGLSAAFYLTLLGHQVTVYEAAAEPGGMLRYALPKYRLPKETVEREVALIRGLGVQFICNQVLGRDVALEQLARDHEAVFLSIGTWEEQDLGVPGRELNGVYPALDFLSKVERGEKFEMGKKVAVIGGGNAAIDSARTALRLGAEVTIVYRRSREDMPAIVQETEEALEEGARLITLAAPVQVLGQNGRVTGLEVAKTALGQFDSRGRRKPVLTNEKYVIPCDMIIEAIGERVEGDVAGKLGVQLHKSGTIQVDPWTLQTSNPKVYAGGDAVSGAANVTRAMAFGKTAAAAIDRQLTGADRFRQLWPPLEYDNSVPPHAQGGARNIGKLVPCAVRRANFNEVTLRLSAWEAKAEAMRCLRCDIKAHAGDGSGTHSPEPNLQPAVKS
jgi:NADH-quinone oxidoreductase subunit F